MSKVFRQATAMTLAIILCALCTLACAEPMSFRNRDEALKYIEKNQPMELTIEKVKMKPSDLLEIRNALPEGAKFHFTTKWGSVTFSDNAEELDLRKKENSVTLKELESIVQICPNIKLINNTKCTAISNKAMIELIEKYPDIQFEWKIYLGKGHYINTTQTAYSTFNHSSDGSRVKLTSENLELLKYCNKLKALDLGHNEIRSLEFLKYMPDLELLIVGHNYITDITPIGQLKHLQYAELFKNRIVDLSPLANCKELLDLNLTATTIEDLSALDNVTTLERLVVNSCKKLPKEAVDHFKELHPDCEVDFKISNSATNTEKPWRKHPRYKHYIWCLKHGKWIPFDEEIPKY
jgi:hypothetical protein